DTEASEESARLQKLVFDFLRGNLFKLHVDEYICQLHSGDQTEVLLGCEVDQSLVEISLCSFLSWTICPSGSNQNAFRLALVLAPVCDYGFAQLSKFRPLGLSGAAHHSSDDLCLAAIAQPQFFFAEFAQAHLPTKAGEYLSACFHEL